MKKTVPSEKLHLSNVEDMFMLCILLKWFMFFYFHPQKHVALRNPQMI